MAGLSYAELAPFVERSELFALLDEAGVRRLARHGRLEHYDAGAAVVRQGEEGGTFYLVASGEVRVSVGLPDGGHEVARLGVGACFGEMAVLTRQPRSATVEALAPTSLVCFWRAPVLQILRAYPQARAFLDQLGMARGAQNQGLAGVPASAPAPRAADAVGTPTPAADATGAAGATGAAAPSSGPAGAVGVPTPLTRAAGAAGTVGAPGPAAGVAGAVSTSAPDHGAGPPGSTPGPATGEGAGDNKPRRGPVH